MPWAFFTQHLHARELGSMPQKSLWEIGYFYTSDTTPKTAGKNVIK